MKLEHDQCDIVLKEMIANNLSQALSKADEEDNWHKYGEGYRGLRKAVESQIKELKKTREEGNG